MSVQERELVHPDIKPENPPERTAHYLDVPSMPWEPTKFPGIKIKVLYTDDTGITTALFKLEPGAVVPLHEHTALEQTYVIEGSLEDHEGRCAPGQFVWRPAGNQARSGCAQWRGAAGLFSQTQSFCLRRKILHHARRAVECLLISVGQCRLPLMAQSRHPDRVGECPLSGVKRTSKFKSVTSAIDPLRKSSIQICCSAQHILHHDVISGSHRPKRSHCS
jgi:quercetin dioxygenase-like cupin family protein